MYYVLAAVLEFIDQDDVDETDETYETVQLHYCIEDLDTDETDLIEVICQSYTELVSENQLENIYVEVKHDSRDM